MKQLLFDLHDGLHLEERDAPQIVNADDVLIRVAYASICGFDMMTIRGEATQGTDGSIGHEASGIVAGVGSGVNPNVASIGDRVTMEFRKACGLCEKCRNGTPEYCQEQGGVNNYMAEYVVVSQKQVYKLPPDVSLKQGCLTEPVVMAMSAVRKANLENAKTLLILGGGAMGLIILKLARMYPVSEIVLVEPVEMKRKLALQFGADKVINPDEENLLSAVISNTGGQGYDAVIEASGIKRNAKIAFQLVSRGGALVYFGLYGMDFEITTNLFQLYWKDISIHAVNVPSNSFYQSMKLLRQLKIDEVITGLFPFSQAIHAFKEKNTGIHAKVMMDMGIDR